MAAIVLIGFMGSGKTTLGRRLATALGVEFIDLDAELEAAHGCSIRTLIEGGGEPAFRALELATLRHWVRQPCADCVIATGGGIVESEAGRALLSRLGRVVYLRADPEACVERLGPARSARPLLVDAAVWRERHARRVPLYESAAEFVVDTHPDDVETSLRALLTWLGRAQPPAPVGD